MSDGDDKVIQFPGQQVGEELDGLGAGEMVRDTRRMQHLQVTSPPYQGPPMDPADEPCSEETYSQLQQLSGLAHHVTEQQAKALKLIFGSHAFICIGMSPDGNGGADIFTALGGNREEIQRIANGSGDGLHGVLQRLLEREGLA